jgi:hypothetical protein
MFGIIVSLYIRQLFTLTGVVEVPLSLTPRSFVILKKTLPVSTRKRVPCHLAVLVALKKWLLPIPIYPFFLPKHIPRFFLKATRINKAERPITHIAIWIQALRIGQIPHIQRISRHEPPQLRIIDPPVHVDGADVVEMLVAGDEGPVPTGPDAKLVYAACRSSAISGLA